MGIEKIKNNRKIENKKIKNLEKMKKIENKKIKKIKNWLERQMVITF